MRQVAIATAMLFGVLADVHVGAGQPFPSSGSPNPAMTGAPATTRPEAAATLPAEASLPPGSAPRAVTAARTTEIPACTSFVDAAVTGRGDGTAQRPHKTIAAAVAGARNGAVICVAEGTYPEQLKPGEKSFTLAGGFQRGKDFKVRDSAAYVTKATGKGGSFIRIEDPGPKGNQLTAIDGFDISGYSQSIFRDHWESQRFDITNNNIHDNKCADNRWPAAGLP